MDKKINLTNPRERKESLNVIKNSSNNPEILSPTVQKDLRKLLSYMNIKDIQKFEGTNPLSEIPTEKSSEEKYYIVSANAAIESIKSIDELQQKRKKQIQGGMPTTKEIEENGNEVIDHLIGAKQAFENWQRLKSVSGSDEISIQKDEHEETTIGEEYGNSRETVDYSQ